MSLGPSALNRLIAARYLIQHATSSLTSISSPMNVAQSILAIHDAAELVFCVLVTERNLAAPEIDGKIRQEPTFMASARAALADSFSSEPGAVSRGIRLMDDINRLRIAFKHHGQLPDVASTYQLPSAVIELLEAICLVALDVPLLSINASFAVHAELVRELIAEAQSEIESGDYKAALQSISKCLSNVFWETNISTYVTPGKVSTEDALLLSGRGIDPAAFITMQKLLPECSAYSEPQWDFRGTGHEANWTLENATFCLETAIQVTLCLQSAPRMPTPLEFHDIYNDVVEIKTDDPIIYSASTFCPGVEYMTLERRLKKGDKVAGVAHGRFEISASVYPDADISFETSEFIALVNPTHTSLGEPTTSLFGHDTLWFKTIDVELSCQSNGRREARAAWLAEQEG